MASKIISWNVNGFRACSRAGFMDWLKSEKPDLIGLQEIKCVADDIDWMERSPTGYQSYWHSAEKAGYSGVAFFCRNEPRNLLEGIKTPSFDREGRVLTAVFDDHVVVNAYFPNSQRDHARLGYKLEFCAAMQEYLAKLKRQYPGAAIILMGDYNIAHEEIDLRNPKTNMKNAGFLPQERQWMTQFLNAGWVDTFRHFVKEPNHYSWWSYRPGVREKNVGWRIDYCCVNKEAIERVERAFIMPDVFGSDHCPVGIELAEKAK